MDRVRDEVDEVRLGGGGGWGGGAGWAGEPGVGGKRQKDKDGRQGDRGTGLRDFVFIMDGKVEGRGATLNPNIYNILFFK